MAQRFRNFLAWACWLSALLALSYHVRYVFFIDYARVQAKTGFVSLFYSITGLGHESFAVFFVASGIYTGTRLLAPGTAETVLASPRRLWLALLGALAISAFLDSAGMALFNGSGLYTDFPSFSTANLSWSVLVGNLLMLEPFVVPTFGSNGMLYLLSYMFWFFALLAAGRIAARKLPALAGWIPVALTAATVCLMPGRFLVWMSIWMAGLAVVTVGQRYTFRPPVLAAAAVFVATLMLSRWLGADVHVLPPPWGRLLIFWKYTFVGAGFALLALAHYPVRGMRTVPAHKPRPAPAQPRLEIDSAFIFFFHFPFVMLSGGIASDWGGRQLMQQPGMAAYLVFAATVTASVLLATATGRLLLGNRWRHG